jgi:hypothetical protein
MSKFLTSKCLDWCGRQQELEASLSFKQQTKMTLTLCVPLFFWMVSAPEIPGSESDSCSGHCFSSKMMGHVSLWWCIPVPPRGMHEARGCTFSSHLSTKCHCLSDAWQKVVKDTASLQFSTSTEESKQSVELQVSLSWATAQQGKHGISVS